VKNRTGLRVALVKERSKVKIAYDAADFEVLVVNVPNDQHRKFFIPASELADREFFAVGDSHGKKTLTVYEEGSHWTRHFLFGCDELISSLASPKEEAALPVAPVLEEHVEPADEIQRQCPPLDGDNSDFSHFVPCMPSPKSAFIPFSPLAFAAPFTSVCGQLHVFVLLFASLRFVVFVVLGRIAAPHCAGRHVKKIARSAWQCGIGLGLVVH